MIQRNITKKLREAANQFGVISLTGPRQSGKTTLVKEVFTDYEYVNLEDLATLNLIKDDPKGFINRVEDGVIIDEVQKFPDLLSYIQVSIDKDFKPGKFILTGSQNLLVSEKVSQSLAGRVAVLTLLPLSIDELSSDNLLSNDHLEAILEGFYPGLFDKSLDTNLFYSSYLNTYIERDVRNIKNITDLSSFQRFLQLLAGRIGQLVNLSEIGNSIGVSYNTIESWLSVLEASYIIIRLQPYFNNFGKRIVKSPKIYFTDVGLASYLLGIDSVDELRNHFALGGLFENMVILDFFKRKYNELSSTDFYFFRDSSGNEVDLLMDKGSGLVAIEIKSSATYNSDFLKGIRQFNSIRGEKNGGFVIYSGDRQGSVKDVELVKWNHLVRINL